VITQAKRTPERAWLAEVASVALVQACQDARRAYRNWFDSRSGRRKGRRVGPPRFRTKHGRQSIRLTRNGFALRGTRLSVAKVGDLRVRWSRELPSVPSSVTVIGEPDGRYYASFVVGRDPTPLPSVARTAGIDLGLLSFATIAASDGTIETLANPRHLRAAARRLAIAQRQLSRKRKGSKNRAKARLRVAVAHRRVRDQRADHHHKLALRLLRENQAVAVEDLAVAGLARTRLAKSVQRRWVDDVCPAAGGQGRPARASGRQDRPLDTDLPDLLGMRIPRRPQAVERPRLGLPGVWEGP